MFLPNRLLAYISSMAFLERAITFAVLVTQVEVGRGGFGGIAGDDDAFEHLMGILFDQDAIIERAWLAFVAIDAQVDRPLDIFGQKGPLGAGGENLRPASAQAALDKPYR